MIDQVRPATDRSPLRIVTWHGYDDPAAISGFSQLHGCGVAATYVDDDDEAISLASKSIGTMDLVSLDTRMVSVLVKDDLIVPVDYTRMPNTRSYIGRFSNIVRELGEGATWSAPYIWGTSPLMYNADHVSDPPESWLDIANPLYRGRVAIADCYINQIVTWGMAIGYEDPTRITANQLEAVIGLIINIKRQTQAAVLGWDEIPEAMARGEIWISTGGWEAIVALAARRGGQVRFKHPTEGTHAWLDSWCILREAPNHDLALAWIDWMIGIEAQQAVCESLICGTVNANAVSVIKDDVRRMFPYDAIECTFGSRADVGLPPLEPSGDLTTLDDWKKAWARVVGAR